MSSFASLLQFFFSIALDPSHFSLRNLFVVVCRVVEREGRAIFFGDSISATCVLRRLSEELFALAFSALSTWKTLRQFMASEGSSWPLVRSEELPNGLFDREDEGNSFDETPSVSGSSRGYGSEKPWVARSYFSIIDVEGLKRIRSRYQIPENVVLRIPDLDERACSSNYDDVAFYKADFKAGLRFPMQTFMRELLDRLCLSLGQLAPNAWRTAIAYMVMCRVCSKGVDSLTVDEFCTITNLVRSLHRWVSRLLTDTRNI